MPTTLVDMNRTHLRTKVFVHGVPETADIWNPLLDELAALGHTDVVRLSPPAFGAPAAAEFEPTIRNYKHWLIDELSRFETPVDLVGHDFGGAHTVNVAMARPDLLHSWVSDVIGVFEPDYVWHSLAQIWQKPGDGERAIGELIGAPLAARAANLVAMGVPEPTASAVAAGQDDEMGRAILSLYRSAAQAALVELGRNLSAAAARPGLAVIVPDDHAVGSVEQRHQAAARASALTTTLEGLGHWWLAQDPTRAARVLDEFWTSLPS
jgi:pimeloyl-ACP methyl ester carboxylesterase